MKAVILAGGSGTRLWPLSTPDFPKQFLAIGSQRSLLSQTADRLLPLIESKEIWVVCGRNHRNAVLEHLPAVPPGQVLAEPEGRNTAAAIALAAVHLRAENSEAVMAVLPADHAIPEADWPKFRKDLEWAAEIAAKDNVLVTLGILPSEASTAYGYIKRGEDLKTGGYRVQGFFEKPDLKTAESYLKQGGVYWNSGMFVWPARVFMEELAAHLPITAAAMEELASHLGSADYAQRARQSFESLEGISVDYAIMEKSTRVRMIPAQFKWSDVGNLTSLADLIPRDLAGNSSEGKVLFLDSRQNIAISKTRPVAVVGVDDLIVIDAPEGVLVIPKAKAQEVRRVVEALKKQTS